MSRDATEITRQYMWAVQALAAPAREQRAMFPEFAEVADELALDHEEAYRAFRSIEGSFTTTQVAAVRSLDACLTAMSGPANASLWTDEAMVAAPEWTRLRRVAASVIQAMGWKLETPPPDRHTYVG